MWQTPKVDWKSSDYFNIEDYNRIKRNIIAIRALAVTLWPPFLIEEMGNDKNYQDVSFYADEINKFEENLDTICAHTFPFAIGEKKLFYENQPFIGWQELNRIESACLMIYSNIVGRRDGRLRLKIRFGGGRF